MTSCAPILDPYLMSNLPPIVLAESAEPPKTWLKNQVSAAKVYLKEAWGAFCSMLHIFEPLERQVVMYSAGSDGSEERIARFLRLAVPPLSLVGTMIFLYYLIDQLNPTSKEKKAARKKAMEVLRLLRVNPLPKLTDYEVCIAVSLVDTSTLETSWSSIGGLEEVVTDLLDSVILPFRASTWVLFYGPPGCGKTLLARATARAANARFFNLQISNLVNMWYGESQKLAEAVFSLAHKLQPSIIFIDEIDSFLTTRSTHDHEATRMMKTQFMALWDGLLSETDSRIMVIGATNRPGDLDSAILRRLPYKVRVPLPDARQRQEIMEVHLRGAPLDVSVTPTFLKDFAIQAEGLSGSDLFEICREAALRNLREWLNSPQVTAVKSGVDNEKRRPRNLSISVADFQYAFQKFRCHQLADNTVIPLLKPIMDGLD
ncbi:ATPase family AAA domain-containing protein 1-A [Taenia crassiceps]|uniref:ATPase family AAA domain-containing protein 1-A n=1 Tax=Taenia crassiceps TaxID=6207 RepID=A0ABR4Q6Q7_9CEST